MACNSCAKPFSFLRKEKGCPGCGFSYCAKCLECKVFLNKLNSEVKVCVKCKHQMESKRPDKMTPPDAYFKMLKTNEASNSNQGQCSELEESNKNKEIIERLKKLKEDINITTDENIGARLQKLKGDMPITTDLELHTRLANLKGLPTQVLHKPSLPAPDTRTEQEQADDLMKQYLEETNINTNYNDQLNELLNDMESRLHKLQDGKSSLMSKDTPSNSSHPPQPLDSEDEDENVRRIVEKMKAEALLEDEAIGPQSNDELPFCEICNEDANMRCLGCKYLFCKRCFLDHKDDDDECNNYEPYVPPKNN